jgi:hypothetical protein
MTIASRPALGMAGLILTGCFLAATVANGQAGPTSQQGQKPVVSEEVFKNVQVLREGKMADGSRVKLHFDKETGLLVRQARYADTAVGTVRTHVIYTDSTERWLA